MAIKIGKDQPSFPKQTTKAMQRQKLQERCGRLKTQLSPIFSIVKNSSVKNMNKWKKNSTILKSTRLTSPNSNQSSELISKQHSQQKKKTMPNTHKSKERKSLGKGIRKRKMKMKMSMDKDKEREKQNFSPKIRKHISDKSKGTRWKNKVLKEFMVQSRKSAIDNHSIKQLQNQLKLHSSESNIKFKAEKSFFGFLKGESGQSCSKTILTGGMRIIVIDWMYLISTSLMLNRQTVHLAVHYLDSYLTDKEPSIESVNIIAAAAMFLSVKQQEREQQSALLTIACMSEQFNVLKNQILETEKLILIKLNFKLKSNTLAFWIDYFSLKWDAYIQSFHGLQAIQEAKFNINILLRSSDGDCYRLYREMMELADVCLMFCEYTMFQKSKLSLACIYLIIRIEAEKMHQNDLKQPKQNLFKVYYKLFMKKASPIFKDPFRVNEIFNSFLVEVCQFEITQIIPSIKFLANFLQLDFCYSIDEKALQQTKSYEDFIRRMTYSFLMKDYCFQRVS